MKSTKIRLIFSTISFIVCIAMLVGTTFAWFTDSVTSGKNVISSGNFDVELLHYTNDASKAQPVDNETNLFDVKLWEPGVIAYENFIVKNAGNIALQYKLAMNIGDNNTVTVDGKEYDLSQVLKVAVLDKEFSGSREDALKLSYSADLNAFSDKDSLLPEKDKTFAVVVYWEPNEDAIDNLYNINGDKAVNTSSNSVTKDQADNTLFIDLGINLVATQLSGGENALNEIA